VTEVSSGSALVRSVLDEYGALTRVVLREYLKGGEPRRYLYDLVGDYPERGGRSLRSSLCIAAARAFGGEMRRVIGSAVALEMMHNAFLIHDDVEDESDERRGHPTLHALYGAPVAINVGDALALRSLRPLVDNERLLGPSLTLRILQEAERMTRESVEGQAIELGWRRDNVSALEPEDYLFMTLKKTCWYTTIFPLRVGALIGTDARIDPDALVRFGFFLGAAFQIQDDLLNLEGDPARYGKEICGDLWEGKRTLMIVHAIQNANLVERRRIRALLGTPRQEKSRSEVRWLGELLLGYGSHDFARRIAHGLAGAAAHEAAALFSNLAPGRDRDFLLALPRWVLDRA
jgi:geranylgeranyl diphosphate synthase type II